MTRDRKPANINRLTLPAYIQSFRYPNHIWLMMADSKFFLRFPEFDHDSSAPLLAEFERLSLSRNWQPGSRKYQKERDQCIINESVLHLTGNASKLQGWQDLLTELSIPNPPNTITKCKKVSFRYYRGIVAELQALKGVWINLIDLLDSRRAGGAGPQRFKSKQELRVYTLRTGKICPRKLAKEDGFIKALLIQIF